MPQMIIRNFADDNGQVWFWRHGMTGTVRPISPLNLFVEGDIYSKKLPDGSYDASLERWFSTLEQTAADVIRQLLAHVRAGRLPVLSEDVWEFWSHFIYYQMKRPPHYIRRMAKTAGHRQALEEAVASAAEAGIEDAKAILSDPKELDRLSHNSMVTAFGLGPSEQVLEAMSTMGMAVYRPPEGKAFVIGDLPFARARLGTAADGAIEGKVSFYPVAPDVAIGFLNKPKMVEVVTVSRDEVRQMNEAVARQSMTFAGQSDRLITSLAQSVSYEEPALLADLIRDNQP